MIMVNKAKTQQNKTNYYLHLLEQTDQKNILG